MTEPAWYNDSGAAERLSRLDAFVLEHFGDRTILKPLTRWNEAYKEFPRYVLEYLCARYIDVNDPLPGQKKIDRILPLPEELREDTAFLDRVHAYLPGWEMPVITPSNYANG